MAKLKSSRTPSSSTPTPPNRGKTTMTTPPVKPPAKAPVKKK